MISVAEMRKAEKRAIDLGIDEMLLMENAGANAARIADDEIVLGGKRVIIFCGTGNNAGDGLVFARHAMIYGARVVVFLVKGEDELRPLPKKHCGILRKMKVEFIDSPIDGDILVDAMLGTGLKGDVEDPYRRIIGRFNSMKGFKISLDCPSGVDCDTGSILGKAVNPDMTVTFHKQKNGLSSDNSGRIIVAHIGIPEM